MKNLWIFFPVLLLPIRSVYPDFIETYPPSGYESLFTLKEAPVDIYFGGHYRTTVIATFNIEKIQFNNPVTVIDSIPGLSNPDLVCDTLSEPMDINAEYVCGRGYSPHCGQLSPDIAGVIFDESTYKALLFINPAYLIQADSVSDLYLPSSDAPQPGLLQEIRLNATGSHGATTSSSNWSLYGNTLLGWKENRIESDWTTDRHNAVSFGSLLAAHDFAGHYYAGGYLSSTYNFSRFTYSRKILGLQFGSSPNTLINNNSNSTSSIDFFMPEEGLVEVYRDTRLISTQQFEVGNRMLDTRSFPGGTYDIELVGRSRSGQELFRQSRLYVKRNRLPVNGFYDYFLEFGDMTRFSESGLPERLHCYIFRGGWQQGIGSQSGFFTAFSGTEREQVGEFGLGYSFRKLWLEATSLAGTQDQYGFNTQAELDTGFLTGQVEWKKFWHLPAERKKLKAIAAKKRFSPDEQDMYLTGFQREYSSISLSKRLWEGHAAVRYSERTERDRNFYSGSLAYSTALFREAHGFLSLGFDAGRIDGSFTFRCTLSWHFSDLEWTHIAAAGYTREDPRHGDKVASWNSGIQTSWNNYDSYRMANTFWSMGASFSEHSKAVDGRFAYGGEPGSGNIYVAHKENKEQKGTIYSAGLVTTLSVDNRGVAIGGAEQSGGNCAVVVIVQGASATDRFQVLINNYPRAFANGGDQVAVPLTAFASYRVSLRPVGNTVFDGVERVETVTLYPGNVKTLIFELWQRKIVIGRLLDNGGNLLPSVCGNFGSVPVCADERGVFQAEGRSNIKEITFNLVDTGKTCHITVPKINEHELLLDLGDVVCD
ncbi:TcfC E-set like domain-containing protein [Endozoicomonadaceae bacterium StTr2]